MQMVAEIGLLAFVSDRIKTLFGAKRPVSKPQTKPPENAPESGPLNLVPKLQRDVCDLFEVFKKQAQNAGFQTANIVALTTEWSGVADARRVAMMAERGGISRDLNAEFRDAAIGARKHLLGMAGAISQLTEKIDSIGNLNPPAASSLRLAYKPDDMRTTLNEAIEAYNQAYQACVQAIPGIELVYP